MHKYKFLTLGICIWLVLAAGCTPKSRGPVDAMVDIGTHQLHLYCMGEGTPTIVLDTGVGDTYASWQSLITHLAEDSRVCAYERAGYGKSDPGPMPRDSQREAVELHHLLVNSEEAGPYLLLGHSLGAINLQVYAGRYPDEVTAMVLVDPPPLSWLLGENFTDLRQLFIQEVASMREFAEAARNSTEPETRTQADFLLAIASEHEELIGQSALQAAGITSFGSTPLIVIGASQADERFGESAEAYRQFWNQESMLLAQKSEDGRFILAQGSTHLVHLDAPEVVLEAIRELMQ